MIFEVVDLNVMQFFGYDNCLRIERVSLPEVCESTYIPVTPEPRVDCGLWYSHFVPAIDDSVSCFYGVTQIVGRDRV